MTTALHIPGATRRTVTPVNKKTMEKNILTFDNSGFVYDLENPTKQTEELSYILKNALLATSPLNIRQETDEEFADHLNREQDLSDNTEQIYANIDNLNNTIVNMGGEGNTVYDWLQGLLSEIRDSVDNMQGALSALTVYLKGETEEDPSLLQALETIAASTGIFMDAPGLSIIDKPELL